jgi:hypothetical protein
VTGPKSIKTRGDRRPSVKVERDKLVAAEGVVAGKTSTEIARELGVSRSTAGRLASQGLREAMESGDKLNVERLFNLVVSSLTEVLEDIDATIAGYKAEGKQVPTRVLTTKIAAGLAIAKTCGFEKQTLVIANAQEKRIPKITFVFEDDGCEWEQLSDDDPRMADRSDNFGRWKLVPKQLPPAPVANAEGVDERVGHPND